MAGYMKKVIYLSYMRSGSKVKGAGFVKVNNLHGSCRLDMRLSGLGNIADRQYAVKAVTDAGEETVLGRIYLHGGNGEWSGSMEEKDVPYNCICKILVEISDYEAVEGTVGGNGTANGKETAGGKEKAGSKDRVAGGREKAGEKDRTGGREKAGEKDKEMARQVGKTLSASDKTPELKAADSMAEKVILSDKWEQLRQLYPLVHPYEDEREYISIKPKDFVIMTGDYQHLANNSFLLHGFYNYRHIILGKEQGAETDNFYLGVPGVYYEREKMVALMFGFEAFECSGGKAEAGKFGYYLKKVKI